MIWLEIRTIKTLGTYPTLSASAPASSGALEYHVLRDLSQVQTLIPQWERLLAQSHCNRAFSSSKWFLAWCRHHPQLAPFVLIANRGLELVAVLPLVLRENSTIDFPSPMCDYNDMVASSGDSGAQRGLLEYAISEASSYQMTFSNVRTDSNCVQALRAMAETRAVKADYQPGKNCFYIQLPDTFAGYLATRSHIFRKGLGRVQRSVQKNGLVIRHLTPEHISPPAVAELFLSLNLNRFGSKSGFASKSVQEFIRELLPSLFVEGKMAAFVLVDGSQTLAIDICMRGWNSLCSWNGGFLPEAAQWSPGRLLFASGIEYAVVSGLQEYDLLRGSHAYKTSWATHSRNIGPMEFNRQSCTDALAPHETKSAHRL
jgi:CelD/BcsL family acetyltransferase involved in cellulose biosynthesis